MRNHSFKKSPTRVLFLSWTSTLLSCCPPQGGWIIHHVFVLSDTISASVPRLAVNLCKQCWNAAADKSFTNASVRLKCTVLVTQHENSAIDTFSISPFLLFTYKGPAKSTPTLANGGACLTLNSDIAAVGGELYGFPFTFLQVTHTTPFTTCLPFGTQYFDRNWANVALAPLWCTLHDNLV